MIWSMTAANTLPETSPSLSGARVAFVGRLAGLAKRDAAKLARQQGATVLDAPDASATVIVIGGDDLPVRYEADNRDLGELLPADVRAAAEVGRIEVIGESQFWQRLGVVEAQDEVRRLYTPGMLADLLGVPVAVVRRWQRRGLIRPVR